MHSIADKISSKFKNLFGEEALIIRSPGRVNIIGEHTDYNEGFVLPAAINKTVYLALSPRNDKKCHIHAFDFDESYNGSVNRIRKSDQIWPDYLMGVVDQLVKSKFAVAGFNCVFGGNIPIGSGLSSSAAIEAGLIFGLNQLFQLNLNGLSMVKMSQQAENEFVGVQCGIMDQLINIFGRENHVLCLDCRSLNYHYIPFMNNEVRVVLCDTLVRRSLGSSEYNLRRTQCEQGVGLLQRHFPDVHSLRDVTSDMLTDHKEEFDPVVYKRCDYVVRENNRVLFACELLNKDDMESFGRCMFESHIGLRDEYEVSCDELDVLVEAASKVSGVLGARMMGAGFGGCTINLVREDALQNFTVETEKAYRKHWNTRPKVYVTEIVGGTEILNHP